MRIEFENGSVIETVESLDTKRSKEHFVHAVEVGVGMKLEVRDYFLEELKNMPNIKDKFKLNIRRLNRWWYIVYFDEICKHDCEILVSDKDKFCLKCGMKVI